MIESVEIENPYHYRGYTVGYEPVFDIQNDMFTKINDHGKVVKIKARASRVVEAPDYVVTFEDGAQTIIAYTAGIVATTSPKES